MLTMKAIFEKALKSHAEKKALIFEGKTVSYRELLKTS